MDIYVDIYEMSAELFKLKALASCLEDKLIKADIVINEEGEAVYSLEDLLQERIDTLVDSVCNQKGAAA